jgi:hypothetical protein
VSENVRVGYVPYSGDLQHPGDRRRLAIWAKDNSIELEIENPLESDLLVLSNAANFGYWLKRARQPVILDLVDGYLGEHPRFMKDATRNIVRSIGRTSDLRWITYTKHLRYACQKSAAIIVASHEQRDIILEFNKNVHIILDDLSELGSPAPDSLHLISNAEQDSPKQWIFWEGFGFTLNHFQPVASEIDRFLKNSGWGMYLVTNVEFSKWGGYIGKVKARSLINKWFPLSASNIVIVPWSLKNLTDFAHRSTIGIIPIDLEDKFAVLKPENKLLSMWKLGLPCLFSPIHSYKRVAVASEQESSIVTPSQWLSALQRIANSQTERAQMRAAGQNYLEINQSHEALVSKWNRAITETLKT